MACSSSVGGKGGKNFALGISLSRKIDFLHICETPGRRGIVLLHVQGGPERTILGTLQYPGNGVTLDSQFRKSRGETVGIQRNRRTEGEHKGFFMAVRPPGPGARARHICHSAFPGAHGICHGAVEQEGFVLVEKGELAEIDCGGCRPACGRGTEAEKSVGGGTMAWLALGFSLCQGEFELGVFWRDA